jgi:hypothetical protein
VASSDESESECRPRKRSKKKMLPDVADVSDSGPEMETIISDGEAAATEIADNNEVCN